MEYRSTTPEENGYDNETEEDNGLREFVQSTLYRTGPNDMLDELLVLANICELRALLSTHAPALTEWYATVSVLLRETLEALCKGKFKPLDKLERQDFYFPDTENVH